MRRHECRRGRKACRKGRRQRGTVAGEVRVSLRSYDRSRGRSTDRRGLRARGVAHRGAAGARQASAGAAGRELRRSRRRLQRTAGQRPPAAIPPTTASPSDPTTSSRSSTRGWRSSTRQGKVLYGAVPTNTIFKGFGGVCEARNNGDAVVRYDQLAGRWLFVMPIFGRIPDRPETPYSMCYAVSQPAPIPLGPYYRYEFRRKLFPDYPRPAIWPDGYYIPTSTGDEVIQKHACVADRDKMLKGGDATEQCVDHRRRELPEQRRHRRPRPAARRRAEHHDGRRRHAAQEGLRRRRHLLLEGPRRLEEPGEDQGQRAR